MNNHDESKLVQTANGKILDVNPIIADYSNVIQIFEKKIVTHAYNT